MTRKHYWGIATLIILLIGTGVFSIRLLKNQDTEPKRVYNAPSNEVLGTLRHNQDTPTPETADKVSEPNGKLHETPLDNTNLISGEMPNIQEIMTETNTETDIDMEKIIDKTYADYLKTWENQLSQMSPTSQKIIKSLITPVTKAEIRETLSLSEHELTEWQKSMSERFSIHQDRLSYIDNLMKKNEADKEWINSLLENLNTYKTERNNE